MMDPILSKVTSRFSRDPNRGKQAIANIGIFVALTATLLTSCGNPATDRAGRLGQKAVASEITKTTSFDKVKVENLGGLHSAGRQNSLIDPASGN
jgi:hypothetical protein